MSRKLPHVGVIIVGFRNPGDIHDCLTALALATPDPSFDVFICENGGNEAFHALKHILLVQGLCDICTDSIQISFNGICDKFAELVCLALKGRSSRIWIACATRNLGYAGAVNAWIEKLDIVTHWGGLWILNPDAEPYPDALAELVRYAIVNNKGMVGSTILPGAGRDYVHLRALRWSKLLAKSVAIGFHEPISRPCDVKTVEASMDCPSGSSMYVTRACVEQIGPMDDRFFLYYEDLDWGIRAKKCGLGYAAASVVRHKGGTTIGSSSARRKDRSWLPVYFLSRNQILFIRKHNPCLSIPGSILSIIYALLYLFAGSPTNCKVALQGFLAGWTLEFGSVGGPSDDPPRKILASLLNALYRKAKLGVSLVFFCALAAWRAALRGVSRSGTSRLTILYYHDVPDKYRFEFARQMDTLRRTAHVVPANFDGALPSKRNCVAITFDDAFESVAKNALPELARRSFHSTIFVAVGLIGRVPDWFVDDASLTFEEPVMTAIQLKSLSPSLVTLGSHGVNHSHLSESDTEGARYEIEESRRRLAKLIDREVDLFAFPYGAYNEHVIEICKAAGYKYVFTTALTDVDTGDINFVRGRVKVDPSDSRIEFFLKSNGAYMWITLARQAASKIARTVKFPLQVPFRMFAAKGRAALDPLSPTMRDRSPSAGDCVETRPTSRWVAKAVSPLMREPGYTASKRCPENRRKL